MSLNTESDPFSSDRSGAKLNVKLPSNKGELLKLVAPMTYKKRIETVCRLARDNKKEKGVEKLIKELEERPTLENPSIAADDDFTDLLPSQEKNVEKHYTEEQLAVFMASSVGEPMLPYFENHLQSASLHMKGKVIRDFVRLEKSDKKVFEVAMKAVPKVKRTILKEAIAQRRHTLVDLFFNLADYDFSFLHACTPQKVKEVVGIQILYLPHQQQTEMARFHGDIYVKSIEKVLETTPLRDRVSEWGRHSGFTDHIKTMTPSTVESLFKLGLKYRVVQLMLNQVENYSRLPVIGETHVYNFPAFINSNISFFLKRFPEEIYRCWSESTHFWSTHHYSSFHFPSLKHRMDLLVELLEKKIPTITKDESLLSVENLTNYKNKRPEFVKRYLKLWEEMHLAPTSQHERATWNSKLVAPLRNLGVPTRTRSLIYESVFRVFEIKRKDGRILPSDIDSLILSSVHPSIQERVWRQILLPLAEDYHKDVPFFLNQSLPIWFTHFYKSSVWSSLESTHLKKEEREKLEKLQVEIFSKIVEWTVRHPNVVPFNLLGSTKFLKSQQMKLFQLINVEKRISDEEGTVDVSGIVALFRTLLTSLRNPQEKAAPQEDFDAKSAIEEVLEVLKKVLESKLTPKQKELFYPWRDVSKVEEWKAMTKEAASAHRSERTINLTRLIQAAQNARDPLRYSEMIQFAWQRVKNEVEETRNEIFKLLFDQSKFVFLSAEVRKAFTTVISEYLGTQNAEPLDDLAKSNMKTGCLNHMAFHGPVGYHVLHFTQGALTESLDDQLSETEAQNIFDFAAEVQFELFKYRAGKALANQYFFLETVGVSFNGQFKPKFVERTLNFYGKVLDPEVFKSPRKCVNYYIPFFNQTKATWYKVPALRDYVKKIVQETKETVAKSSEGHLILESDDPLNTLYVNLQAQANSCGAFDALLYVDSFMEIVKTLFESFLCNQVFFNLYKFQTRYKQVPYVSKKEDERFPDIEDLKIKGTKEKFLAKDKFIRNALSVSPSAIRLRLVWSHLVRARQDLLNRYIGKQETFHGIFSTIDPKLSKKDKKKAKNVSKPTKTSSDVHKEQVEEKEAAKNALDEGARDHEQLFVLPATYGLRRLFQTDAQLLALQQYYRILNLNIATAERTKAAQRWTLNPSTNYPDIVNFLNERVEKAEKETDFPVVLVRSLYRGLLLGDDPIVPIHFLLSPTTLAKKDYCQVSIYSITKSVPVTQPSTFLGLLKVMLGDKRRKEMNVSIHKQIARFITANGGLEAFELVLKEMERKELHRDVRIVCVKAIVNYLNDDDLKDRAWDAIAKAGKRFNADELMLLLAATPASSAPSLHYGNLFLTPQLQEQWTELKGSLSIPGEYCERYAKEIIKPLTEVKAIKQAEKLDDLRLCATFVCYEWSQYLDHEFIAQKLVKLMKRVTKEELKPYLNDMEIFKCQFDYASSMLVNLCTKYGHDNYEGKANKQHLFDVMQFLCDNLEACLKDNYNISYFQGSLKTFFLRTHDLYFFEPDRFNLTYEEDLKLVEPVKKLGLFYYERFHREIDYLNKAEHFQKLKEKWLEAFEFAYNTPTFQISFNFISAPQGAELLKDLVDFTFNDPSKQFQFDVALFTAVSPSISHYPTEWSILIKRIGENARFLEISLPPFSYVITPSAFDVVLDEFKKNPANPIYWKLFQSNTYGLTFLTEDQYVESYKICCISVAACKDFNQRSNEVKQFLQSSYFQQYAVSRGGHSLFQKIFNGIITGNFNYPGGGARYAEFLFNMAEWANTMVPYLVNIGFVFERLAVYSIVGKPWGLSSFNTLKSTWCNRLDSAREGKIEKADVAMDLINRNIPDNYSFAISSLVAPRKEVDAIIQTPQFQHYCLMLAQQVLVTSGGSTEKSELNPNPVKGLSTTVVDAGFEKVRNRLLVDPNPIVRETTISQVKFNI